VVLAPTLSERLENITLGFSFFFKKKKKHNKKKKLVEALVICCATVKDLVPSKKNLNVPLLVVLKSFPVPSPRYLLLFHRSEYCRRLASVSEVRIWKT